MNNYATGRYTSVTQYAPILLRSYLQILITYLIFFFCYLTNLRIYIPTYTYFIKFYFALKITYKQLRIITIIQCQITDYLLEYLFYIPKATSYSICMYIRTFHRMDIFLTEYCKCDSIYIHIIYKINKELLLEINKEN